MIDISYINGYFPPHLASNAAFQKHILKEYIQLMVLDYLADTPYIGKLAFIRRDESSAHQGDRPFFRRP